PSCGLKRLVRLGFIAIPNFCKCERPFLPLCSGKALPPTPFPHEISLCHSGPAPESKFRSVNRTTARTTHPDRWVCDCVPLSWDWPGDRRDAGNLLPLKGFLLPAA